MMKKEEKADGSGKGEEKKEGGDGGREKSEHMVKRSDIE